MDVQTTPDIRGHLRLLRFANDHPTQPHVLEISDISERRAGVCPSMQSMMIHQLRLVTLPQFHFHLRHLRRICRCDNTKRQT